MQKVLFSNNNIYPHTQHWIKNKNILWKFEDIPQKSVISQLPWNVSLVFCKKSFFLGLYVIIVEKNIIYYYHVLLHELMQFSALTSVAWYVGLLLNKYGLLSMSETRNLLIVPLQVPSSQKSHTIGANPIWVTMKLSSRFSKLTGIFVI